MPDPATIGIGAIAAYLGKDGLQKLLGPTADYLGIGLKDFAQKRTENIGRIFQNAERKLGDKIHTPGEVPPKVLKEIINEGSYCDDELAAEYFGGVLASSRTVTGRDDRGARMAKVIDSLSTYQLRTHYLFYSTVKKLFADNDREFVPDDITRMEIYMPGTGYFNAMDFNQSENNQFNQILGHVFHGLSSECLITDTWRTGNEEHLGEIYKAAKEPGIICTPTSPGVELFLWAFGSAEQNVTYLFDESFVPQITGMVDFIEGAVATKI